MNHNLNLTSLNYIGIKFNQIYSPSTEVTIKMSNNKKSYKINNKTITGCQVQLHDSPDDHHKEFGLD